MTTEIDANDRNAAWLERTLGVKKTSGAARFWRAFGEIFLIFAVFVVYGAWPTPDVNEQYYVGKAIHFWNHEWLGSDPFLNTPDSHWLFYACFGLLSFLFSQNVLVWVGRVLVWLATACAWRRLSRALIPVDFVAVLTAAAFAFYLESFHLAGEWIIGGIEGKSIAFPFVFWGLAHFIEGKFNRGWILLGIASAFHVLVGGWTVLACLFGWALDAHWAYGASLRGDRAAGVELPGGIVGALRRRVAGFIRAGVKTLPGLLIGGGTALLGVVPALRLDVGASADVIRESRRIYVYERLSHHLVASSLPWTFQQRFLLLVLAFVLLATLGTVLLDALREERRDVPSSASSTPADEKLRFARLQAFVVAALLIAGIGAAIDWGSQWLAAAGRIADPKDAAGLLRYYWYRLSDWAVPLGVVFLATRLTLELVCAALRRARACVAAQAYETRFFGVCASAAFTTLLGGFLLYWVCRFFYYRHAVAVATAAAVDALLPIPKPTESVSFIATVDILLFLLLGSCTAAVVVSLLKARKRGAAPDADDSNASRRSFSLRTIVSLLVCLVVVSVAAPCWRLTSFVDLRGTKVIPRSAPPKESIADGWIDACQWVRDNTPEDAIFLVPRGCESFKWHARRAEAGNWKEIPQDAKSIVTWSRKMEHFYANPGEPEGSPNRWNQPLNVVFINKGRQRVLEEAKRYGFQYAVVETPPYTIFAVPEATRRWQEFIDKNKVYENPQFVVLKLQNEESSAEAVAPTTEN